MSEMYLDEEMREVVTWLLGARLVGNELRAIQAAETVKRAVNSHASLVEENKRMREALEYANKGLNMVHNGLMDPTRPRQSVGEVCAHFLEASNKALGDTNA